MVIYVVLGNRIAVRVRLYKPMPRGDRVLFPTGQRRIQSAHLNLRDAVGSCLACRRIDVVVDNKNTIGAVFAHAVSWTVTVCIVITVQDSISQRLADQLRMLLIISFVIPAEGRVGSCNHITVAELLSRKRLLRNGLRTVASLLGDHALVTRENVVVRIVHVDLDRMNNLSSGCLSVVDNGLSLLDAGSKLPIPLGNELVVGCCCALVIGPCCHGAQRERAYEQNYHKDHRQDF